MEQTGRNGLNIHLELIKHDNTLENCCGVVELIKQQSCFQMTGDTSSNGQEPFIQTESRNQNQDKAAALNKQRHKN